MHFTLKGATAIVGAALFLSITAAGQAATQVLLGVTGDWTPGTGMTAVNTDSTSTLALGSSLVTYEGTFAEAIIGPGESVAIALGTAAGETLSRSLAPLNADSTCSLTSLNRLPAAGRSALSTAPMPFCAALSRPCFAPRNSTRAASTASASVAEPKACTACAASSSSCFKKSASAIVVPSSVCEKKGVRNHLPGTGPPGASHKWFLTPPHLPPSSPTSAAA